MKYTCYAAMSLFLAVVFVQSAFAQSSMHLFRIERSKNANIVQYDVRLDADGNIDRANPIDVYWLRLATNGERAEISAFERPAFGFSVTYSTATGNFDLRLRAVDTKPITIKNTPAGIRAVIQINGEDAYLTRIFVNSRDGFLGIPRVVYYIIYGLDPETLQEVSERIDVNNRRGG